MLLHCGLLLMCLNCVRTTEYVYDYALENSATRFEQYSFWPSTHNAMQMIRLRKRETSEQVAAPVLANSEGGVDLDASNQLPAVVSASTPPSKPTPVPSDAKDKYKQNENEQQNATKDTTNVTSTALPDVKNANVSATTKDNSAQLDFAKPGVLMRGFIVFGGFLLLGVAYFIFYRGKTSKNDASNTHSINDGNQFRYGVLQSEDRRDNLELSRIPLTMESDDDDDDEDLEIFDLEQKRKSLSYVNLQTNDEDIVFNNSSENSKTNDRDNLLLDIEDAASDTLLNWTNNGNKSIL